MQSQDKMICRLAMSSSRANTHGCTVLHKSMSSYLEYPCDAAHRAWVIRRDTRRSAPGLSGRESLSRQPSGNALSRRSSLQRPPSQRLNQPAWEGSATKLQMKPQQKKPVVAWNSRAASAPQSQRAARSSSFQSNLVSQVILHHILL